MQHKQCGGIRETEPVQRHTPPVFRGTGSKRAQCSRDRSALESDNTGQYRPLLRWG